MRELKRLWIVPVGLTVLGISILLLRVPINVQIVGNRVALVMVVEDGDARTTSTEEAPREAIIDTPMHSIMPSNSPAPSPTISPPTPTPEPDIGQIAFTSDRHGNWDIYLMKEDGGSVKQLTYDPGNDSHPAWSPDGRQITFASARDGNWEIYLMNADGTGPVRLTNHRAGDANPTWSPDRKWIAFHSNRDGDYDLFARDVECVPVPSEVEEDTLVGCRDNLVRITDHPADDEGPAWSPDGKRIAFRSNRDGNWEIYVLNLEEGVEYATEAEPIRLTKDPSNDFNPKWSPDSRFLILSSNRNDNYDVFVLDVEAVIEGRDGLFQLTQHEADDRFPTWSPDGERIVFTSIRDGNWELYVINVDGSGLARVTRHSAADFMPVWGSEPP